MTNIFWKEEPDSFDRKMQKARAYEMVRAVLEKHGESEAAYHLGLYLSPGYLVEDLESQQKLDAVYGPKETGR